MLAALFAPWLAPFSPDDQPFDGLSLDGGPLPPGPVYWLGTDTLGRDLLSRLLFGARTSLVIGLVANGVAVAIGMAVGIVGGYQGGWIGTALMRFTDLMMAFPALLLAIVLAALLHPSLWIVAMVIALVNWVQVARIVYTETRGLAERDFILAERSLGAGHTRILFRHIAPHLVPTAIVWGTLGIATTVLLEATLELPRRRRAAAAALLGQHHLREPELLPGRALAGLHPRRHHPADGAVLQPARRCPARSPRSDPAGTGLMLRFLSRRFGQALAILFGVALVTFLLLHGLPADPAALVAGRSANAQMIANVRHQLGLDLPLPEQFWRYLTGLLRGQSRPLLHPAQRGRGADLGADPRHAGAHGGRHPGRGSARPPVRHARRRPAQRFRRSCRHDAVLRGRFGAAIRRGTALALRLRRNPRLVPDERLRHARPCGAAGP